MEIISVLKQEMFNEFISLYLTERGEVNLDISNT
jgi:hypothetical protein